MHVRKRIRDAVVTLLSNLQTTGANVYNSRSFSLQPFFLPSLSVFTTEEAIERVTLGAPVLLHRVLTLIIEAHAVQDQGVEDVLDQIAHEVEAAMAGVLELDGQQLPTQLTVCTMQQIDEGEQPLGVLRLTYTIPYATNEATPDTLN